MTLHLAGIENVTGGPPPRVPASTPTVSVFMDGARVAIPSAWRIAFSSAKDRDVLFAIDTSNVLHVLVIDGQGQLRALHGLTKAFIDDIFRWRFPAVRR